jgi:hypothetical protein
MLAGGISIPIDRSGSAVQSVQRKTISRCKQRQPNTARKEMLHPIARDVAVNRPATSSVAPEIEGAEMLSPGVADANSSMELIESFPNKTRCPASRRDEPAAQKVGSFRGESSKASRFPDTFHCQAHTPASQSKFA